MKPKKWLCTNCFPPPTVFVKIEDRECSTCRKTTYHWEKEIDPMEPQRGVITWQIG